MTRPPILKIVFGTAFAVGGIALLLVILPSAGEDAALASVRLADGRILEIEGAAFGTNHVIGKRSLVVERFGPWLPTKVSRFLSPKLLEASFDVDTTKAGGE